jgi:glutaredoxin
VQGKVELYGRAWCHLCEEMAQGLRAAGIDFEEIDVDSDPRLEAMYGEEVPVLLKDGAEVCRHRLTAEAIAKLR